MLLVLIPFTGFKIPVLRAGLIGVSVAVAKIVDYGTDFKKLLLFFFAGVFILISPSMIASPSFLLSFSAVYGLLHMDRIRVHRYLSPFMVGLVATAFIIPAASTIFGSFNISSVVSTPVLIPILSLQVITFLIYLIIPSISLEPLILLEKIHLGAVELFFAENLGFMFTLYKAELGWAMLMGLFSYLMPEAQNRMGVFLFFADSPLCPCERGERRLCAEYGESERLCYSGREDAYLL